MPNSIKYNTSTEANALNIGDFYIGTNDVAKGPTASTGFYSGINPPSGSYTIYLNKESQGSSITCPSNDTDFIAQTNSIAGASYTTINECFTYFSGQSDKFVMSNPTNTIVTDSLLANFSAGILPSYPRSGTTFYDLGTMQSNGSVENGVVFNSSGWFEFDGVDDYLEIPGDTGDTNFGNTDNFSFEVYFLLPSDPTTEGGLNTGAIVTKRFRCGIDFYYPSPTTMVFRCGVRSDSNQNIVGSDQFIALNKWYHVVFTYEPSSTTGIKMYINGEFEVSTTNVGQGDFADALLNYRGANNYVLGGTGGFIDCNINGTKLYGKTLSQTEISTNYHQAAIVTDDLVFAVDAGNLISYYNNVPYNATVNSLVSTVTGTLTNGVAYNDYANGNWYFDGVDDYISCGNDDSVNIAGPISVEAWVVLKSTPSEAGSVIVTKGNVNGGAATVQYNVHFNTNRAIVWQISDGSSTNSMTTTDTIDLGDWYHICCTHDADNTNSYVYINGELSKSDTSSIGNLGGTSIDLTIGYDDYTDRYPYNGMISNVRIYSKTLSASEILQNYNANINRFN